MHTDETPGTAVDLCNEPDEYQAYAKTLEADLWLTQLQQSRKSAGISAVQIFLNGLVFGKLSTDHKFSGDVKKENGHGDPVSVKKVEEHCRKIF